MSADVGADILDLAETMITSDGLQYEPVSKRVSFNNEVAFHLTFKLFCWCFFFSLLFSPPTASLCLVLIQAIFELTPQQRLWQR